MSEKYTTDTLTIGKKKILVRIEDLNQADLNFYAENPRVYSALNVDDALPSQKEIEEHMKRMEHVRELADDIKSNGGLMEEIIVRDGDFVVLEGNSRLAAYRILCENDPITWGKIKCKILPNDIKDDLVFKLIGQFHIKGKKPWEAYEQASYLYRRMKTTKLDIKALAKELGIPAADAKNKVDAVTMMKESNEVDNHKFSYYYEYIKNNSIKKYRSTSDEIDKVVIQQIQRGEIENAADIRLLGKVAAVGDKQSKKDMKRFIDGEISIYDAYDDMEEHGKLDNSVKKLKEFRNYISTDKFEKNIKSSPEIYQNAAFEIKKINARLKRIMEKMEIK